MLAGLFHLASASEPARGGPSLAAAPGASVSFLRSLPDVMSLVDLAPHQQADVFWRCAAKAPDEVAKMQACLHEAFAEKDAAAAIQTAPQLEQAKRAVQEAKEPKTWLPMHRRIKTPPVTMLASASEGPRSKDGPLWTPMQEENRTSDGHDQPKAEMGSDLSLARNKLEEATAALQATTANSEKADVQAKLMVASAEVAKSKANALARAAAADAGNAALAQAKAASDVRSIAQSEQEEADAQMEAARSARIAAEAAKAVAEAKAASALRAQEAAVGLKAAAHQVKIEADSKHARALAEASAASKVGMPESIGHELKHLAQLAAETQAPSDGASAQAAP